MTRTVGIALAALVGLVLTACRPSGFQYVSNPEEGAYLRFPGDWHRFDPDEVLEHYASGLAPSAVEVLRQRMWGVAFDAAPEPSLEHIFTVGDLKDYPVGYMQVRKLTDEQRDQLSLSDLRNEFFPFDNIEQLGVIELLRLEDLTTPEGLRGVNLRFNLAVDDGLVTYDQTAYVDADTETVYLLTIGCTADCFQAHSAQIDQIIQSWTIKEPTV